MKLLWHSNAPWYGTGYGNQTETFITRLAALGHQVIVSAQAGLNGAVLDMGDTKVLPGGMNAWGNDILPSHVEFYDVDAVITLLDVWVLEPSVLQRLGNVFAWLPVDHDPAPKTLIESASACAGVIAFSRFGEQILRNAGLSPYYVPHGIDSNVYKPADDRTQARKLLGVSEDATFIAGMVMANKGQPSRKAFDQQIRAFAAFHKRHPDSLLYMHTNKADPTGENLERIMELAGLPASAVKWVSQYHYVTGMLRGNHMSQIYSGMDVLMNASHGEGFGIPIVEAQMCGTPVIVTDFSSMPELCMTGWKAAVIDKMFTYQGSYQAVPSVADLEAQLEAAYAAKGDQDLRREARAKALAYDADLVAAQYWKPMLDIIARHSEQRREQIAVTKDDLFYSTGLYIEGELHLPAKDKDSDKALVIRPDGRRKLVGGWGNVVDGITLDIEDNPTGGVSKIVCREIISDYQLHLVEFKPGDVVLDIGAQVGVVSCYLAKKHPQITVYAFEPVPENFARLQRNIKANSLDNVIAINKAVTGDGRRVTIYGDLDVNAGGSSIFSSAAGGKAFNAESVTLKQILQEYAIERVRLLKLDCEGAEYEIVLAEPELLKRVDIIRGELHSNNALRRYSVSDFGDLLRSHVPDVKLSVLKIPDVDLTPDVSVIIPTYNGEKTIARAISGALSAGGEGVKVEVVIFDDGSTDGTREILMRYKDHPMVTVLASDVNRGQVYGMNMALKHARGRYWLFHGDDDWLNAYGLVDMVKAFDATAPSVGFVYGPMQYQGERTDLVFPHEYRKSDYYRWYACLSSVLFRRAIWTDGIHYRELHEIDGFKSGHAEDWDYVLQVIEIGYVGLYVGGRTALNYTLSFSRGWSKMKQHEPIILNAFKERHPDVIAEHL